MTNEGEKPKGIPPEHLEHQLELIVSSRVGEGQVAWTIFSVFWAAEVLLLGVLLQGDKFQPNPVAGLVVSVVGLFMSVAWGFTQGRGLKHLERFETLTRVIEDELEKAEKLRSRHKLSMHSRFPGIRARTVMQICGWGAAVAWFIAVVIFLCHVCVCHEGSLCF